MSLQIMPPQTLDYVSALGTISLVLVTAIYTHSTRRLVRETKQAREDENNRRQDRISRQKRALRKTLKSEIKLLEEHHNIKTSDGRTASALRRASSRAVFERNTDKLGLLDQDEIDAVVDYYMDVEILEELYQDETFRDDDELDTRSERLLIKQTEALDKLHSRLDERDQSGDY